MTKPLYHGKTIIKEIDTQHPINLHIGDQGGRIYDLASIFPEYFLISVPLFDDVIKREIDEWLYVMKNSDVKEDFKSPYMKKVAERLSILKMNDVEKDEYYRYMKEVLSQRDAVVAAEEKGKAEGIEIGLEKGKYEGVEENKIFTATKMLKDGLPNEMISKYTGLSIKEIEDLKEKSDK